MNENYNQEDYEQETQLVNIVQNKYKKKFRDLKAVHASTISELDISRSRCARLKSKNAKIKLKIGVLTDKVTAYKEHTSDLVLENFTLRANNNTSHRSNLESLLDYTEEVSF